MVSYSFCFLLDTNVGGRSKKELDISYKDLDKHWKKLGQILHGVTLLSIITW